MERIISKDKFGNIACNNIIIYSDSTANLERNIKDFSSHNWKVIEPKYFRYRDDNSIVEVWYDRKGIMLYGNIEGYISESFTTELIEKITYEEVMYILEQKQNKDLGYNNKDLMSRVITNVTTAGVNPFRGTKEKHTQKDYGLEDDKQQNNGGASDWYSLPKDANTLQDLIEHRNMNGSVKDIFKACYRLGIKTEDELRDANKMAYYALREIGRVSGRKDYITIATELMGSQAIEEYCTCKECNGKCNGDCMI